MVRKTLRLQGKRTPGRALSVEQRQRRELARRLILTRVERWSETMDIAVGRVAIRDQKTRWGSASSLGNLNFSWRIAGMPDEIQDYIVIHELAHLQEMNHSRAFWAIVARFSPDFREHRIWLREHGRRYQKTLL